MSQLLLALSSEMGIILLSLTDKLPPEREREREREREKEA
jgi:hypothetical protein